MEYDPERPTKKPALSTQVTVALIGAFAIIVVSFITYWKDRDVAQIPIQATLTKEAELTRIALATMNRSTATPLTQSRTFTSVFTAIPIPLPPNSQTPTSSFTKPTDTPRPTAMPTLGIGSSTISPFDGATMMFVPAGEFLMGSIDADKKARDDEKPQHTVYLPPFWIDKFEVTNSLYKKCVDAGKCRAPSFNKSFTYFPYYGNSQFDTYPVIYLSWDDAANFCKWAGKRLPTEAQWEKAARGTDGRIYPWGNTFDKNLLNSSEGGKGDTTQVSSYPAGASPYGAMDMAGNVWEWVADWYNATYYASALLYYPTGPSSGQSHVMRGGSFAFTASEVRVATRSGALNYYVGVRCVE